jgi:hypothetical protein
MNRVEMQDGRFSADEPTREQDEIGNAIESPQDEAKISLGGIGHSAKGSKAP